MVRASEMMLVVKDSEMMPPLTFKNSTTFNSCIKGANQCQCIKYENRDDANWLEESVANDACIGLYVTPGGLDSTKFKNF